MNRYTVRCIVKDATSRTDLDKMIYVDADTPDEAKEKCANEFRKTFGRAPYAEQYEIIGKPYPVPSPLTLQAA